MIFGHNTNITLQGVMYHVQTEDRGTTNALLETTVYCRGRVLHRLTNNYFDLLPLDADKEAALKLRLDEQHRGVLEDMRTSKLVLTAPAVPGPEVTSRPVEPKMLTLELINPKSWLKGKHAVLQILVKDGAGKLAQGAGVTSRVEGAASPADASATSGPDGHAHLEFEMPRLTETEPAIVVEAMQSTNGTQIRGQLRFQLRAKPRVPTA